MKSKNNEATTADVLSEHNISGDDLNSSFDFGSLDDIVYNSSSSFDISEIADLLLDNIDEYVFITDSVSKNIVYINRPLSDAIGVKLPFVGTCYSLLRGRDTPCPECSAVHAVDDNFHVTSLIECTFNNNYVIKSKNIEIYSRTYTINVALKKNDNLSNDISDISNKLSDTNLIIPFTNIFTSNIKNPDVQVYRYVECIGFVNRADYVCLYEFARNTRESHSEHTASTDLVRSHIWCSDSTEKDKEEISVPDAIVKSVTGLRSFSELNYENSCYCVIPLAIGDSYLGCIIIKTPDKDCLHQFKKFVKTISGFVSSALSQRRMYAQLSTLSNIDELTGLKNRKSLLNDVNSLSIIKNLGVIFLNVNGLKEINSSFGTKKGDTILKKTASLLTQLLHESSYIYRIGGDEFLGIYPDIDEHEFSMLSDMMKAFMSSEKGFSVSVGTSWIALGINIQSAINLAESDMYSEKKKFYRVHSGESQRYRPENDVVLNIVEPAKIEELISNNCFRVLYQPKFKIQGEVAEISGAEALVRLIINDNVVPPDDFIPALESAHYTHLIDYFVLETVCKRMKERIDNGEKVLPVSCNFSRHTIVRPEFKNKVKEILQQYSIPYELVPLEVSEHTNTERHQELVEVTERLSKEGFNISIDDFGTAHANIYTLADLAVNEVKFDKKLIDNLGKKDDSKLTTILGVLITMCKKLGIKTIAEGVEDEVQNEILKKLGCDEIQGYFYSKPIKDEDYYSKL